MAFCTPAEHVHGYYCMLCSALQAAISRHHIIRYLFGRPRVLHFSLTDSILFEADTLVLRATFVMADEARTIKENQSFDSSFMNNGTIAEQAVKT